jgi:hypothetical protein
MSASITLRRMTALTVILVMALLVGLLTTAAQEERVLVIGHVESTDSLDPSRGFTQTTGFMQTPVKFCRCWRRNGKFPTMARSIPLHCARA